jgi:lipid-A-disaccharide synthase
MARDIDLLLAIFPFERAWYAARVPELHVEFVGHPMLDRYETAVVAPTLSPDPQARQAPRIALLPGSREGEVRRHLPIMIAAAALIRRARPDTSCRVVAANEALKAMADRMATGADGVETQIGGLAGTLSSADLAIASTGTVTMECAYFGVPAVAMYKTSWLTYTIGRRIVTVAHLAMPNLIAGETLFPELVQREATPERVARAALDLLDDEPRRARIREGLTRVVASLGGPGASRRAAGAILGVVQEKQASRPRAQELRTQPAPGPRPQAPGPGQASGPRL